ncbi:MAG: hypothetical protein A3H45_00205 [Ignavibacteria bacterium RIFCSPLOWO2_02_FULL_55_14]|nr:MAG: hypothetical protein A3H45_00205 [Ignavibacteria bacterium RIFCSPLOWO2_02_FULL_55_14]
MTRSDFWCKGVLVLLPFSIVSHMLLFVPTGGARVIFFIISVAVLWPGLALMVKRLHDRNRSGWFLLTLLIPVADVYFAVRIVVDVCFLRGTAGPNGFGDEPLQTKLTYNYSMFFDREHYGFNLYIAAGFLLASLSQLFTWQLISTLVEPFPPLPTMYYVVQFVGALLETAVFVFCSYAIRRNWLLPLVFGVCLVVVGIIRRGIFSWLQLQNVPPFEPFIVRSMFFNFVWGFLLLAALVYAVRLWDAKIWGLGLGMVTATLLDTVFVQSFNALTRIDYPFGFDWTGILTSILDGIIFGVLIYLGIILYFKQKGFTLQSGVTPQVSAAS